MLQIEAVSCIDGPPGSGKTNSLREGIVQLVGQVEKVLVSAPSNTAVDNIAKGLILQGVKVLRVCNDSKVDEIVFSHTPEVRLSNSKQQK